MTLNQWYEEGLIDRDIATLNGDQVTAKMTSDKAGASVGWAASRMQLFMTSAQQTNPEYTLVATPTPTTEKGATPEYGYVEISSLMLPLQLPPAARTWNWLQNSWITVIPKQAITCSTSVSKAFPMK